MISINDTIERPKAAPTYRVRTEAMAAAVFELGPHARNGFEFLTFKCDGLWQWRSTDEIRPPTPAQIKANGGKKSLLAMATAITQQEATPMAKANETTIMPACNGLDIAKSDGLDIPTFLKRASGPLTRKEVSSAVQKAASSMGLKAELAPAGTYDELKTSGALRSEPVGAPDAKVAARRKAADEEAADLAKKARVAKPAGKPPVSRKAAKAKTAAPAENLASEAETKTAGHPTSKAALIKAAILDWKDDEAIVQEVRAAFPGCEYKASDIKWYRRKMAKAKA